MCSPTRPQAEYDFSSWLTGNVQVQVEVTLNDGTKHYSSRMAENLVSGALQQPCIVVRDAD